MFYFISNHSLLASLSTQAVCLVCCICLLSPNCRKVTYALIYLGESHYKTWYCSKSSARYHHEILTHMSEKFWLDEHLYLYPLMMQWTQCHSRETWMICFVNCTEALLPGNHCSFCGVCVRTCWVFLLAKFTCDQRKPIMHTNIDAADFWECDLICISTSVNNAIEWTLKDGVIFSFNT